MGALPVGADLLAENERTEGYEDHALGMIRPNKLGNAHTNGSYSGQDENDIAVHARTLPPARKPRNLRIQSNCTSAKTPGRYEVTY